MQRPPNNATISKTNNDVPRHRSAQGTLKGLVVESPEDPLAPELQDDLLQYLQFEIRQQGTDGAWQPFWSWGRDDENWKRAEQAWKGILTLRFLRVLKNFYLIQEI